MFTKRVVASQERETAAQQSELRRCVEGALVDLVTSNEKWGDDSERKPLQYSAHLLHRGEYEAALTQVSTTVCHRRLTNHSTGWGLAIDQETHDGGALLSRTKRYCTGAHFLHNLPSRSSC